MFNNIRKICWISAKYYPYNSLRHYFSHIFISIRPTQQKPSAFHSDFTNMFLTFICAQV